MAAINRNETRFSAQMDDKTKELFLIIIKGLKQDTPEGIGNFSYYIEYVTSKKPPEVFAFGKLAKDIADKLRIDLLACRNGLKAQDVIDKIENYLNKANALNNWISLQRSGVDDVLKPVQDANNLPKIDRNTRNTIVDQIRGFFRDTLGYSEDVQKTYQTEEAAKKVISLVTKKITDAYVPLDCGLGNIRPENVDNENIDTKEIPRNFVYSTNNRTDQFAQGAAFAKLDELVKRMIQNRKKGLTNGVFIFVHNFILSSESTAQRMTELLISARRARVPVLLSYDQFGTSIYAKGGASMVEKMKKAGIGIACVALGQRLDHRKIYFFGTGDGHVTALAGGQGWCDIYGGEDWDKLQPVSEKDGRLLYPAGKEPWLDHMRLLDGEAAYQGAINFLGMFAQSADKEALRTGLGIVKYDDPGEVSPTITNLLLTKLKHVGNITTMILNNVSWDIRPITEVWYNKLSDPEVQEIRIAQPYITDPVFRDKLKAAVNKGKNIKILVPGTSDCFMAQWATKYLLMEMNDIKKSMENSGKPTGNLEIREWHTGSGIAQMVHMKYGIFIHKTDANKDCIIDGSYNATAAEARSNEKNADILVIDHKTAVEAAAVFDDYFNRANIADYSSINKVKALTVMCVFRPFM